VREALRENLVFANTHFLPVILPSDKVSYDSPLPCFESQLFRNQIGDLLSCEQADDAEHLSYMQRLYNSEFEFGKGPSTLPRSKPALSSGETAVIPFTFGKESLLTFALALELGIKPVLFYCQEPSQPFEERYKLKMLEEIRKRFDVPVYFVKNGPGLLRYGKGLSGVRAARKGSEVGWGAQTTILGMLAVPIVFETGARYILFGSEYSNREYNLRQGWKAYLSYDQTPFWTAQHSNMIRSFTADRCSVHTMLEPLEEIGIFSLLQERYPELGRFQFSCSAEKPLFGGTQWCHECYKCDRIFLFARCCGIDPGRIGFKRDLLNVPGHFKSYFDGEFKTGSNEELNFSFYLLHKQNVDSFYGRRFESEKLPFLRNWSGYRRDYTQLHEARELPPAHEKKLMTIFRKGMKSFAGLVPE
jgi:hypothetical protein